MQVRFGGQWVVCDSQYAFTNLEARTAFRAKLGEISDTYKVQVDLLDEAARTHRDRKTTWLPNMPMERGVAALPPSWTGRAFYISVKPVEFFESDVYQADEEIGKLLKPLQGGAGALKLDNETQMSRYVLNEPGYGGATGLNRQA